AAGGSGGSGGTGGNAGDGGAAGTANGVALLQVSNPITVSNHVAAEINGAIGGNSGSGGQGGIGGMGGAGGTGLALGPGGSGGDGGNGGSNASGGDTGLAAGLLASQSAVLLINNTVVNVNTPPVGGQPGPFGSAGMGGPGGMGMPGGSFGLPGQPGNALGLPGSGGVASGVFADRTVGPLEVKNSILVYIPSGPLPPNIYGVFRSSETPTMPVLADYNDVWGWTTAYGGGVTVTNGIQADPLFVNGSQSDFHLQFWNSSPCVDTGLASGSPDHDRDNAFRPFDGDNNGTALVDMGAYEAGSVLRLEAATWTVAEGGSTLDITVERMGSPAGQVSVLFTTTDGSATAGSDYTAISQTLTWADGNSNVQVISIPILEDALIEGTESFTVTLSGPSDAYLGTPYQGTVTITDNDVPMTCSYAFSGAEYESSENGSALIEVQRTGDCPQAGSVHYQTHDSTATAGLDYTATEGTLTWGAGQTGANSFSIPITVDTLDELDETVQLVLDAPTGGSLVGPDQVWLTIHDDDQCGVSLSADSYGVLENNGIVSVTAVLDQACAVDASVQIATADGTATAGSDYTAASTILSWDAGDVEAQSLTVTILDDLLDETDETFQVTLSEADGLTMGSPSQAVITIVDNEGPVTACLIQFGNSSYTINEDGGMALIGITLTGACGAGHSVSYVTGNGSALAGYDYTETSGVLTWENGDTTEQYFMVPILDDVIDEPNETVQLTLHSPVNAFLGTPSNVLLSIQDNDISLFLPCVLK
ncbi:MAG TPA: Calx-beta domain-containing protein, partial [Anaerolineaceae bacterium]|nr:Calx-beta domain-containing protein [Anaerolineaceae bacterium]